MKRYAFEQLKSWKENPNRKPLVIRGARQVGKTWLMREFAKECYAKVAYISFVDTPDAKNIFEGNYNLDNILLGLNVLTNVQITPHDTLIIIDEIQECERALNALKFFKENAPDYHIIAAGSLLGVAVRQKQFSFPVGQVDFLNLYPLSFCEFLDAIGENKLSELILDKNWAVLQNFQDKCINLLKQYMFVGGMPEAVQSFATNKDMAEVRRLQNAIITGYKEDFSKYTESYNVPKINAVWNSLPTQLAKENKKFTYKDVQKGARAREYEAAVEWLTLTGLVYKIHKITKPDLPISGYEEASAFKLYMIDTGLLCAKAMLDAKTIIEGNKIFEEFKGALTEQYVLQELKIKDNLPITYWGTDKGTAEIDFVIQDKDMVIPIEVKATVNLKAKSLASYRQKYNPKKAVRTSLAGFEENNGLFNLPLYMIENLVEK
ncbi:MAG: ATP-binding protein [Alphaproteobacteria bacterium]|nr:ATP-binding protein [Alphaproteobacteria bacterium]